MPEADVETNSLGRDVDKNNDMAQHINLSPSTNEQNAPRVEDWLTVSVCVSVCVCICVIRTILYTCVKNWLRTILYTCVKNWLTVLRACDVCVLLTKLHTPTRVYVCGRWT